LNHEQRRAAQVIADRTDDLTCMVNDMLDVSRLKSGILSMWRRPAQLAEIVFRIRPMLERRAARENVRLQIGELDHLPTIFCDAGKVSQILINLVVNSIKFTGADGRVELWARAADRGRITVGITDNGPGIEPDKLQIIFDRFTQLDHDIGSSTKGMGLGLAIVKEFVALNLGDLSVQSEPGTGSTFSFTLPQSNHLAVFDCYLDGLNARDPTASISLIEARLRDGFDEAVLPVVDEFLQRSVHPEDVACMISAGHWRILIRGPADAQSDSIERIEFEWASTCRNWIHGSPPELIVQSGGVWQVETAASLRKQFASEAGVKRVELEPALSGT
jgi:anti-sigma regulatory factor (Ser/Thr protein kinase)